MILKSLDLAWATTSLVGSGPGADLAHSHQTLETNLDYFETSRVGFELLRQSWHAPCRTSHPARRC